MNAETKDAAWPHGYGKCHCGCGAETRRARQTATALGIRKGDPMRYVHGHNNVRDRVTVTCEECGADIEAKRHEVGRKRFCSHACKGRFLVAANFTAEARERGAAKTRLRVGDKNPAYQHGGRSGVRDRAGERRFQSGQAACQHSLCEGGGADLSQHHVVYRQHVEEAGGDVWDPRNALALCRRCHAAHHRRARPLAIDCLRPENIEFARELLGVRRAEGYLRRRYTAPEDLPRFPAQPAIQESTP